MAAKGLCRCYGMTAALKRGKLSIILESDAKLGLETVRFHSVVRSD